VFRIIGERCSFLRNKQILSSLAYKLLFPFDYAFITWSAGLRGPHNSATLASGVFSKWNPMGKEAGKSFCRGKTFESRRILATGFLKNRTRGGSSGPVFPSNDSA
jgi:hypothetical protein